MEFSYIYNSSYDYRNRASVKSRRGHVTYVTPLATLSYNQQIDHSLNLKKTGSAIATGIGYFTLFITSSSFPQTVFSQQQKYARINLISSTVPVQPTSSFAKNNYLNLGSTYYFSKFIRTTDVDCGAGASAIQVRSGTSINSGSTVLNMENAVDNDISTYSTHHIEGHQKNVEIWQVIAFTTTASASDVVKIYLSLKATLQNHTVSAQAYYWVAADGSGPGTPVGPVLDISNLNVLPAAPAVGTPSEIVFSPGVIFNRVKIGVIANSNGNNAADLNLHHVQLTPPPPTTDESTADGGSSEFTACEGEVPIAISNSTGDIQYKWYNATNTEIPNGGLPVYTPDLTPGSHIFYVSALKTGCTIESPKHKITVIVNPKPTTPSLTTN